MKRARGSMIAAAMVIAFAPVLAACTSSAPEPAPASPSQTAPTSEPTATASPTAPAVPTFYTNGTATENKPIFDYVSRSVLAKKPESPGRAVIDALAAAGFDKSNMQVTPDKTTIGNNVDSVLFSVRVNTECLLGQFSGSNYSSSVQAALKDGSCLVGATRTIDW